MSLCALDAGAQGVYGQDVVQDPVSLLLQPLDPTERELLQGQLERRTVAGDQPIVEEGAEATHLFLLRKGRATVERRHAKGAYRVGQIEAPAVIGEMALFDRLPRTATVRAEGECVVDVLAFQKLRPDGELRQGKGGARWAAIHEKLMDGLLLTMGARLRHMSDQQYQGARAQAALGELLVNVVSLLAGYTILLEALDRLSDKLPQSSSAISLPLLAVFGWGSWRFIRNTGIPLADFGLGFRNLLGSVFEASVLTVPFMALLTGVKWLVLMSRAEWRGLPLFEHTSIAHLGEPTVRNLLIVYGVSSLVQEMIVRSALQSTLEMFLWGKHRTLRAIVVASLCFSVNHMHLSFLFACLVFLPGMFWGWLFHRRRHILGPALSHLVVGGYVFFMLGTNLP